MKQMKELHPRFRFHTADWLIRHFLITHCQVMSRSFARAVDPDVVTYKNYMKKKSQDKINEAHQGVRRRRIDTDRRLVLPGPKVNVLF